MTAKKTAPKKPRALLRVPLHAAVAAAPRSGATFAARVIAWQRQHGRHDLPWQNTRDAYRIWVSEIMLQQTQVAAVIGYYARFLARFPTVALLAESPQEEVMRYWAGLGYYSRARNLHRAAQIIMAKWGGALPQQPDQLVTLPGIGRSTAAAIAVFAYGARAAILDGNVKRVVARCFGVEGYPGEKKIEEALWERVSGLLLEVGAATGTGGQTSGYTAGHTEAYTQGLMDLGATLCTRNKPKCSACPLRETCVAHHEGRTALLPQRKPKKATPQRTCVMLVLRHGREVLLEKRPPAGIWGGLWCLPQFDTEKEAARSAPASGADWNERTSLDVIEHGFTHYHLTIQPISLRITKRSMQLEETSRWWLPLDDAQDAALPAPVKKLLTQLAAAR